MVDTQDGVGLESFDQNGDTGCYRAAYDVSTVPPSLALASALAATMDADPTDIDPLHESLDPDALDDMVGDPIPSSEPVTISLFVEQFDVTISSTGSIRLDPNSTDGSDGGIAPQVPR